MNRQDRRRHGAITRRWDTARRVPRGFRIDHNPLSAIVDQHGTPIKLSVRGRSTMRQFRNRTMIIDEAARAALGDAAA